MSDPVSLARSARENLAQGLAALQEPTVPPDAQDVAEPVALAMSALHRIEATRGTALSEAAPQALDAVRRALSMLQNQPAGNPSVERAIEAIADSLGVVHALNQAAQAAPPMSTVPHTQPSAPAHAVAADDRGQQPQPPAWSDESGQPPAWQEPQPAAWQQPEPQSWQQPEPQSWQQPEPQRRQEPEAPQWKAPQPQWEQPQPQTSQQPAPASQPQSWQPPQPAYSPPSPAQPAAAWNEPQPARPQRGPNQKPPVRVEAELGAHSSSNFYKGLSGNDVIDSGGIFIATYQVPEVGQDLIIKVSLPGGYEFEAMGVVKWTRDAPDSGADAPPGYGAQFTQISPEGRQLVYRYVRNREPLFHDDL